MLPTQPAHRSASEHHTGCSSSRAWYRDAIRRTVARSPGTASATGAPAWRRPLRPRPARCRPLDLGRSAPRRPQQRRRRQRLVCATRRGGERYSGSNSPARPCTPRCRGEEGVGEVASPRRPARSVLLAAGRSRSRRQRANSGEAAGVGPREPPTATTVRRPRGVVDARRQVADDRGESQQPAPADDEQQQAEHDEPPHRAPPLPRSGH